MMTINGLILALIETKHFVIIFVCFLFILVSLKTFIIHEFSEHATHNFKLHKSTDCHKSASIALSNKRVQGNNQSSKINADNFDLSLSRYREDHIKKNREYLSHFVEISLFLAKQGMSYRGHQEEKT